MKKMIIFMVLCMSIILIVLLTIDTRETKNKTMYIQEEGNISLGPIQGPTSSLDIIEKKVDKDYTCILTPQASYKMTVKIKSVNTLNFTDPTWRHKLSKYDLGVVWGKLADKNYDKYIRYSQINRYLSWNYNYDIGLDNSYITSHISNNHIIPANNNLLNGVSKLKVDDICYIEGRLVTTEIFKGDTRIGSMGTSLTRTDSGDGACENLYVEKLVFLGKTYQ